MSASVILPVVGKPFGDCMRNANKSRKILYSAMETEVEKRSGIRIRDRISTKS